MTVDVVEQPTEQQAHRPSLSPSRAADFKTCPLLYRFRSIDRLPEQPSPDQARGTLVHAVLERLFDLPPTERTREQAAALIEPQWERLLTEQVELAGLFADGETPEQFLVSARGLLDGGADLLIVETCQDILQTKSALAAIFDGSPPAATSRSRPRRYASTTAL